MPTPVLSPKLITAEASIFNCGAQTVNTLKAVGILTGVNAKLGYGTGVGVGIGVKQTSGKAKLTPNILVIANTITFNRFADKDPHAQDRAFAHDAALNNF